MEKSLQKNFHLRLDDRKCILGGINLIEVVVHFFEIHLN